MKENKKVNVKNQLELWLFCALIGAVAGALVWTLLKIMSVGIEFLWEWIPNRTQIPFYTVIVCTVGALIIGVFRKKYGDYPEELETVKGKIKTEKREKPNSFSDNGMGMSADFKDTIFDPFTRAESSVPNKIQGTGLGMAITRNLVEAMGGTIKVESELAKTIPIIAMTANAFSEDIQRSLAAGMNAHISKPVDMKLLEKTIRNIKVDGVEAQAINQ